MKETRFSHCWQFENNLRSTRRKEKKCRWIKKKNQRFKEDDMVVDGEVRIKVTQQLKYSEVDKKSELKRRSTQSSLELDLDNILMITQLPVSIQK